MKRLLCTALLPCGLLLGGLTAFADDGRQTLIEEERKINVSSYNPTAPEVQLGYATKLSIDESGTVRMDSEDIQGNLDSNGLVYIEAVKGKDDIYYVIEKGGYVLSILAKGNKLVSDDGAVVQIKIVDWIYGRNGLADDDGFKSNIVPRGFLPKTGLDRAAFDEKPDYPTTIFGVNVVIWILLLEAIAFGIWWKLSATKNTVRKCGEEQ